MAFELGMVLVGCVDSQEKYRTEFTAFVSLQNVRVFLRESPHLSHLRRKFVMVGWDTISADDVEGRLANTIAHVLHGEDIYSDSIFDSLIRCANDGRTVVTDLYKLVDDMIKLWRDTLPNTEVVQDIDDDEYFTGTTQLLQAPSLRFQEITDGTYLTPIDDFCFDLLFEEFDDPYQTLDRRLMRKYNIAICCYGFLKQPEYVDAFCTHVCNIRDRVDDKIRELQSVFDNISRFFPSFDIQHHSILSEPWQYYIRVVALFFRIRLLR
uniref:Uncharacterized protein n=1 Tax=viral metagenome TaxID=1070528 RepID=A0A6C0EBZ5_9ZZZZ